MKHLKFRTNSRHISQLGRELVTDFVTALVELIKNSYDADAEGVKIILENPNTPKSKIIIIDTGTGMKQTDFINKWMVIGTNNKITEPYTKKGRKKSGKKGIGRFSVERLAEKVTVYSFPDGEQPFKVSIDWNNYEEINVEAILQRVNVLENHQDMSAAKYIANQIDYFMLTSKVKLEDKKVVMELLGDNIDNYEKYYNSKILSIIKQDVVRILKRYEDIEQLLEDINSPLEVICENDEFEIYQYLNEIYKFHSIEREKTGVILVMQGLRDEWTQKDIDKLQKELRLLVAPDFIEKDPFKVELDAPDFQIEDTVLVNEILDLSFAQINAKIYGNGFRSTIAYVDKDGGHEEINEIYDAPLLCGDINLKLYFYLRDSAHLSNESYNFRFALRVLDTYCGIKIYRDNFRVKPYGDIGNDWLLLDQRKVKDTHGYLVGNNQTIGVIKISDVTNPLLIDATNREGIIENQPYDDLREFVTKCTDLISAVRFKAFNEEQKKLKKLEDEKTKIDYQMKKITERYDTSAVVKKIQDIKHSSNSHEIANKIENLVTTYIEDNEKKKDEIIKLKSSYDSHYEKAKKMYQSKIEFQESELNLYKNLASLGMLTGSFGHETSDIVNRISDSIYVVDKYLDNLQNNEKAKKIVSIIDKDFKRISAYSNLIVNFLKKRKRVKIIELDFNKVLNEVCEVYSDIARSFGIELTFSSDNSITYSIKQIDLESIIINMITNAFEQVKGTNKRIISINISQNVNDIIITFEDSGSGVPKGKETVIFLPFETTKEDGIGLGLSIVKDIVENYNGKIKVEKSEKLGGAKFIVTFSKGAES